MVPKALFLCVEDLAGAKYTSARDLWRSRMPSPDEADALGLPLGAPVMTVLHAACDADGRVLEASESVWPADRIVIVDDYPIEQASTEQQSPSEV